MSERKEHIESRKFFLIFDNSFLLGRPQSKFQQPWKRRISYVNTLEVTLIWKGQVMKKLHY